MTQLLVTRDGPVLKAVGFDAKKQLRDVYADRPLTPCQQGGIWRVRIVQNLPQGGEHIVELGAGQTGRLSVRRTLRAGDFVAVEVKADARADGKLMALTLDLTLRGRFFTHLPQGQKVTLSRRLNRAAVTPPLAAFLETLTGGWICRPAAIHGNEALWRQEVQHLQTVAATVADGMQKGGPARCLVPPPPLAARAVLDGGMAYRRFVFDDAAAMAEFQGWCKAVAPDLLDNIALYTDPMPLTDAFDLDAVFAGLAAEQVNFPGGNLIIQPTAAFVAIDVNGGGANPLDLNIKAAKEVARQIRLRNLSGVILIDFVSMKKPTEQAQLLTVLRQAVATDPLGCDVYGLSKLGILEMTRLRRTPPLHDVLAQHDAAI
jgi:ribonuclease G